MDRIQAMVAFTRVVDTLSFTGAARELRVKQSTVSKWMAALEAELGVQLFERTTRSLRVTESGRAFYERARAICESYDAAVADARRTSAQLRGRLRVSLPVVFGERFVVTVAAEFARRHPEVEIELVLSDRYVNPLQDNIDIAVRIGIQIDSSLRSHTLGESPRLVSASPDYLAAHGTPRRPRDLESHECLVHTDAPLGATWSFAKNGKKERCRVRGRLTVNHSGATRALTLKGFGISRLADWLVDEDIKAGRLVPLLPDYRLEAAPIRALTPPGPLPPARSKAFIALLQEELGSLKKRR